MVIRVIETLKATSLEGFVGNSHFEETTNDVSFIIHQFEDLPAFCSREIELIFVKHNIKFSQFESGGENGFSRIATITDAKLNITRELTPVLIIVLFIQMILKSISSHCVETGALIPKLIVVSYGGG